MCGGGINPLLLLQVFQGELLPREQRQPTRACYMHRSFQAFTRANVPPNFCTLGRKALAGKRLILAVVSS